jgi:Flp pilus assembly CpaF family ATPase
MILKNLSYFQEKENITGKKDRILTIDCTKCSEINKDLVGNKRCLKCLLYNIYLNKKQKFNLVSISNNDLLLQSHQFDTILEYYNVLKKIQKLFHKFINVRSKKCNYEEFKCKLFQFFSKVSEIREYEYYDPISLYKIVFKLHSEFKIIELKNPICRKCQIYLKNLLNYVLEIFDNLKLINDFKDFKHKDINFYEFLLAKPLVLTKPTQHFREITLKEKNINIDTYKIGDQDNFQVTIFQQPYENEKLYRISLFFEKDEEENYFDQIINDITLNVEIIEFEQVIPLEKLIELYKKESVELLKSKYRLSESQSEKYGFVVALKKLSFYKIFPLLIDDKIEEIFLDSPNDEIYVNHQIHGRSRTGIRLGLNEIERLKTFFRLYSGKRLDYMNPSIKLVIKNQYFYCRFAIDIEPIQIESFALDIRKLNKNVFTIQDLLKNDTLNPSIAAFLFFILLRRRNITITGETDTGKTTLINALDLLAPKEFRKIYVENVTESLRQLGLGKHQLKYRVDSLEDHPSKKYSKSNLIKTLLHRTPDLIYLGEILTKEEAEAMFHCLAAGLKGFQTIHANSISSLINRFKYHFGINQSCFSDLDLLLLMKKEFNSRKIISVSEIKQAKNDNNVINDTIFSFDPLLKNWTLMKPLYETKVITEITLYENLSKEKFTSYIDVYTEIFEFISKIDDLNQIDLINLIHKISYFSFISIESLIHFWDEWKNERTLYQ